MDGGVGPSNLGELLLSLVDRSCRGLADRFVLRASPAGTTDSADNLAVLNQGIPPREAITSSSVAT
jgi:hypothetical protein